MEAGQAVAVIMGRGTVMTSVRGTAVPWAPGGGQPGILVAGLQDQPRPHEGDCTAPRWGGGRSVRRMGRRSAERRAGRRVGGRVRSPPADTPLSRFPVWCRLEGQCGVSLATGNTVGFQALRNPCICMSGLPAVGRGMFVKV